MRAGLAALLLLGPAALSGCSGAHAPQASPTPVKVDMTGDVLIYPGSNPPVFGSDGDTCEGQGRYGDIHEGASVTITDQSGVVVAMGSFYGSKITQSIMMPGYRKQAAVQCTFSFRALVPEREFYGVEVGQRGVVRFSRAQVDSKSIHLSLG